MVQIGVMGLGPMGAGLSANLAARGYDVALWNRSPRRLREFLDGQDGGDRFRPTFTIDDFVRSLERPRQIFALIAPTGVESVLMELRDKLSPGDLVMDCGNTPHEQTRVHQERYAEAGVHLLACGVASGPDGAREGISATVSGDLAGYTVAKEVLERVGATVDGFSCCRYVGQGSIGHYAKVIHNGVEYSQMQAISEIALLLRKTNRLSPGDIAIALRRFNKGFGSFVLSTACDALAHVDSATGVPFVDMVVDGAVQNGSGRRAAVAALELGVASTAIAETSSTWYLSVDRAARARVVAADGRPLGSAPSLSISAAEDSLWSTFFIIYEQAYQHLATAGRAFGWDVRPTEVFQSWEGACVRSELLGQFITQLQRDESGQTFLDAELLREQLDRRAVGWRLATAEAIRSGVAAACISSTLSYFDNATAPRSGAALIQAFRSRLGGNAYKRVDAEGLYVTNWSTGVACEAVIT